MHMHMHCKKKQPQQAYAAFHPPADVEEDAGEYTIARATAQHAAAVSE